MPTQFYISKSFLYQPKVRATWRNMPHAPISLARYSVFPPLHSGGTISTGPQAPPPLSPLVSNCLSLSPVSSFLPLYWIISRSIQTCGDFSIFLILKKILFTLHLPPAPLCPASLALFYRKIPEKDSLHSLSQFLSSNYLHTICNQAFGSFTLIKRF